MANAIGLQADVLSIESLRRLAGQTLGVFGRIDILVNGTGGAKVEAKTSESLSLFDLPEDAIRWVFALNLRQMGSYERPVPCGLANSHGAGGSFLPQRASAPWNQDSVDQPEVSFLWLS
jgi:NAD(P)-dependent dehydrogenase (short-subunit alcohol dehydrogenase family)